MKRLSTSILLLVCGLNLTACHERPTELSLAGSWYFALDSTDIGISENWATEMFTQTIQLPGTTDDAGYGNPNLLEPLLQKPQVLHLTRKNSYLGPAWYQKEVEISKSWSGKRIELKLERALWKTSVWVDGHKIPYDQESLVTPHVFDLTQFLNPGKHLISIRVDNREQHPISNGMAHAYTNETQIKWNGIIGDIKLVTKDQISIDEVQVFPDVQHKQVKVVCQIDNAGEETIAVLKTDQVEQQISLKTGMNRITFSHSEKDSVRLWNEFTPNLYKLDLSVQAQDSRDEKSVVYAYRDLKAVEEKLILNDKPLFLRGTLECCIFPLTGYPAMDKEGWKKIYGTAREWGLNHLRFHSWCPPEAAFQVADSMGFYLQVELPLWDSFSKENVDYLQEEADRILKEYGNHPSFCFFSMGNELEGDYSLLQQFMSDLKKKDPRHLYTLTSFSFSPFGEWPEPNSDYFITQRTRKGWVRGQGVFNANPPSFNQNYDSSLVDMPVPTITHEIGQYAVYPDLEEIEKYTGVLDPVNFKAVKADLEKKGLADKADDYLKASGKLAALLYKEEVERALKTNGISGFQLLDLHDFPGQGTALVGLLNAFWESKGVIDAAAFRQFCAPVVPLANFPKAVYRNDEVLEGTVQVANYGNESLDGKHVVCWLDIPGSNSIRLQEVRVERFEKGMNLLPLSFRFDMSGIQKATKAILRVEIKDTDYKNEWDIWIYPSQQVVEPEDVVLTADFKEAEKALQAGKNVLLNPPYQQLHGLEGKFVPVFWSPVHFPAQAGTMGLLLDPKHPAFAHFPTESHTNWQWWPLTVHSTTLYADSLYRQITPLVECVDNFANNRRLCNLFEAKCLNGKLVVCSMDLLRDQAAYPESKQLLYSIVEYMKSDSFAPDKTIPFSKVMDLQKMKDVN